MHFCLSVFCYKLLLTIWLISVIGIFCGEDGGLDDGDELFVLWLRAGVGGAVVVIGCTLTVHSFEWRLGKLKVFVHCDKLRTILFVLISRFIYFILKFRGISQFVI